MQGLIDSRSSLDPETQGLLSSGGGGLFEQEDKAINKNKEKITYFLSILNLCNIFLKLYHMFDKKVKYNCL